MIRRSSARRDSRETRDGPGVQSSPAACRCAILPYMGAVLPRRDLLARGAGSVAPQRLQAAVDFIVDRVRPDQLILYGSAARGLFTARSDL